uniref:Uncharacterized protein n=1 Tax=Junco hyemalis TaxID=40217 RepID=A0A8C5I8B7_JUNHY
MAAEEPQQPQAEPLGGSDADGVNCLAYDEAIMAQQDRIQQEIAVQNPLVSERLELAELYKEYAEDDHVYQEKIKVRTGRDWDGLGGTGRDWEILGYTGNGLGGDCRTLGWTGMDWGHWDGAEYATGRDWEGNWALLGGDWGTLGRTGGNWEGVGMDWGTLGQGRGWNWEGTGGDWDGLGGTGVLGQG